MSDDAIEPIGKETAGAAGEVAKFGTRALDSIDALGRYATAVFGTLPHDLVASPVRIGFGNIGSENIALFLEKTKRILAQAAAPVSNRENDRRGEQRAQCLTDRRD